MHISWGNWDVRVYAGDAWVSLALRFAEDHPEIIDRLERMLIDPVPAVRLQVAQNLHVLGGAAPDRMWAMGERIVSQETNSEIIASYLSHALRPFSRTAPERCEALLSTVKGRLLQDLGCDLQRDRWLLESIGGWAADFYVGQGRTLARTWLEEWAVDPMRFGELLDYFNSSLRGAFFFRYSPESSADELTTCSRAQESLALILGSTTRISAEAYEVWRSDADEPDKQAAQQRYFAAEKIIYHAMNQLYFGSGAHVSNDESTPGLPDTAAKTRFLTDYADELAHLASSREPATLHHLIELYEFLIPGDPVRVFEAIHAILLGRGEEEGYQHESLAISVVVRIVQLYIADHRGIFEDEGRRAKLVSILQLFSEAGWTKALTLLYDLPDLLR